MALRICGFSECEPSLRPSGTWDFDVARRVLGNLCSTGLASENIVQLTVNDRTLVLLWCGTEAFFLPFK